MSQEKRYVDVNKLKNALLGMYPAVSSGSYSSGQLDQQVQQLISSALISTLNDFKMQLARAIEEAAEPYSQCMLCTRKSHDFVPEHPLGENR
jgi:hypothetical protein